MIVLFDMDGTLTPARESIDRKTVEALKRLAKHSRIGIISGSDMDYIQQQCNLLWELGGVDASCLDILPCNGTKLYKWEYTDYVLHKEADMKKEIGISSYKKIMRWLFEHQAELVMLYPDVGLTGTFFQYRGSLLNWCPIGRIADATTREEWEKYDSQWKIRETYMEELEKYLEAQNIPVTVALGGATSFDIYPNGWNKTYGLQHYPDEDIYFVGDKCMEGGNDWHIYEALKSSGKSWSTTGPDKTIKIIDGIIKAKEAV